MENNQRLALLKKFSKAWNEHDVETLMACMHEDCIFETVAGDDVYGQRISGFTAVREAFSKTFTSFPDAQWLNGQHWLSADQQRGISETTFVATAPDGGLIEANMVDVFTFKDDKILIKNAFRKNRPVQKKNFTTKE
ncbi:nuclear transport factor 2 family protein [Acinetobacter wuhouensis]|uniref:nuclear transport factor 2 family protein n=1 Tax=Acinetobacter TaxID=469 RepID=UPI00083B5165|nr:MULTISPECIES: nuclear transport factor 2 family protein [Acinetobacter]AXQ22365.1 nuclear transport factor 2 family protein [Acinetobacter wuhouensis]RZG81046.1 nuclear transport factor 2 family protein [Acinetobacter sp. WCHAc060033]